MGGISHVRLANAAYPHALAVELPVVPLSQVSGKVWKGEAEKRASADKNAIRGSSWEKKMREKALRKAFLDQKQAAREALKDRRKVRQTACKTQAVHRSFAGSAALRIQ